jgi:Tfp pilus assembly protein PilF
MANASSAFIESARGYLALGMVQEADDELCKIGELAGAGPDVLRLRAVIYERGERWELMKEVADTLVLRWPEEAAHWIALGWATRRACSIPEAVAVLQRSLSHHPQEAVIHYNLACYAAQTGVFDEARKRLEDAIRLNPAMRELALEDPDLGRL